MSDSPPDLLLATIPKFPLGHLTATPGALAKIALSELQAALNRHSNGDWGDLDEHDRRVNESALAHGGRLFSQYDSQDKTRFWIITECDRSVTTILLPEEY